jgi:hypothetical protein
VIELNKNLTPTALLPKIDRLWRRSAECIDALHARLPLGSPAPVFTVNGHYTSQGWTEWTKGFQFGSALMQFDATDEQRYLEIGRSATVHLLAPSLTNFGVHDHGFNIASTYGALWRLMNEGRLRENEWERRFYELALRVSGAIQAARWSATSDGGGFIYSFNGPQSLFVDTIRSCRSLALAHQLGHSLMGEGDDRIDLLARLTQHATTTARYNVYFGAGRDAYDVAGRTAHEAIFNPRTGDFRCPSTQQGYSPFSTWTRGQAWAMLGFAELLEWLATRPDVEFDAAAGRLEVEKLLLAAARATCDFYLHETPACGVPYWDTAAPGLALLGDYRERRADPFNDREPVDSSAAAIAAQGLLRMGHYLVHNAGETEAGVRYVSAGLTIVDTLLAEPYLSADSTHEGLILHSVYHRPKGWDYVPPGRSVPCGESSMWGDYHAREVALYVQRLAENGPYYTFFGPIA